MSGPARRRTELRQVQRESTERGERLRALTTAYLRLQHLFEISKLLTDFHSVEGTVPEVVAIVAKTLPVSTALFVFEASANSRVIAWHTAGVGPERLRAARAHAQAAYRRLTRSGIDLERGQVRVLDLPASPADEARSAPHAPAGESWLLLPLVVGRGSIFGALQIEGAAPLREVDLAFVNAVVNQLAIAIDRQVILDDEQAAAEAREARLRFLAQATSILGLSLDYRQTIANLVQLAVPVLADVCFFDEIREDGTVERTEVAFADERKQDLAPRLRRILPREEWPAYLRGVLESGEPRLVPSLDELAPGEVESESMRALGARSLIVVPLVTRGRVVGALKLISAESDRRYTAAEVAFVAELGRRAAIAMHNARLYDEAQRATRARDDVLAVVSHDLKNLLGAILMSLAVVTMVPEESRKPLAVIRRSADRMSRLIADLLDVASIDAGRFAMELGRQLVGPMVDDALEAARPMAASKSQRLECTRAPGLPPVLCDPSRLQQILTNLLGNAIKFTPEGGTIRVAVAPTGPTVTFSVTDTGPGIDEAELPHLFDRFWQARRTARLGTGLGLFIVKGIVEAHGGEIWVDSRVGAGSTFHFTLRVAPAG